VQQYEKKILLWYGTAGRVIVVVNKWSKNLDGKPHIAGNSSRAKILCDARVTVTRVRQQRIEG